MARARKPSSLKQGKSETKTQLAKREEMENKLKGADDVIFDVPETLSPLAQSYYKFIVDQHEKSGILSNLDYFAVEKTAKLLVAMDECEEIIEQYGRVYEIEDKSGNPQLKENPAVKQYLGYLTQFRAMFNQLGLSPAGRAHLSGLNLKAKEEEADPLLQLLKGGKA